jgi:hypothetical protein
MKRHLQAEAVDQPQECRNHQDRCIEAERLLPQIPGDHDRQGEIDDLDETFAENVPGDIGDELPEGGQKGSPFGTGWAGGGTMLPAATAGESCILKRYFQSRTRVLAPSRCIHPEAYGIIHKFKIIQLA